MAEPDIQEVFDTTRQASCASPQACGLVKVPEEYYEGDPWEDCKDIAEEDLADFLDVFVRSLEKSRECQAIAEDDSQPWPFSSFFGWGGSPGASAMVEISNSWSTLFASPEADAKLSNDDLSDRFSIGAASTPSSLSGICHLESLSSSRHSTAPSTARQSFETPGGMVEREPPHDWEEEFLLLCNSARTPPNAVQTRLARQVPSTSPRRFEHAGQMLAAESLEDELTSAASRCMALMKQCRSHIAEIGDNPNPLAPLHPGLSGRDGGEVFYP